jgi:hypothetical protein
MSVKWDVPHERRRHHLQQDCTEKLQPRPLLADAPLRRLSSPQIYRPVRRRRQCMHSMHQEIGMSELYQPARRHDHRCLEWYAKQNFADCMLRIILIGDHYRRWMGRIMYAKEFS